MIRTTGIVRDGHKHKKTGFTMKELRYKVTVVVKDKMSCSRAVKKFGVSKVFVSKWSHIYKVRKLLNSKYKNCKVPMSVFDSTSICLIIKKFGRKAHETIIELCNTKEYQGFGLQKPQKKLWEKHEIRMVCSASIRYGARKVSEEILLAS